MWQVSHLSTSSVLLYQSIYMTYALKDNHRWKRYSFFDYLKRVILLPLSPPHGYCSHIIACMNKCYNH